MIVVRVELWSAITGERTEIARAIIDNIGGTEQLGDYRVRTLFGRSEQQLDKSQSARPMRTSREGRVYSHPRLREHVWSLVTSSLIATGYRLLNRTTARIYPEGVKRGLAADAEVAE